MYSPSRILRANQNALNNPAYFGEGQLTQTKRKSRMQGTKLYVGNLSYSATNQQVQDLFATHGEVKSVNIIEGKGFGFVEMGTPEEAQKAMEALNGADFGGRNLKVDEARPPKSREERGGGGGGFRGGDRGGFRGGDRGSRGGDRGNRGGGGDFRRR
jgi:RNA recognition motif-containing protein